MRRNRAVLIAYGILLLSLAFTLGYLIGYGRERTPVQIITQNIGESQVSIEQPDRIEALPMLPTKENPLDLNTATQEQLEMLPGIGPELAGRIIAYRENNGNFVTKEQIMDVAGIGEKRFAAMEDIITIGGTK